VNKQPSAKLDSDWVKSYNIASNQPSAITSLVSWLGIVDHDGAAKPELWNKLRQPASRADALAPLVHEDYSAVFDRISVKEASREELDGSFINAYGVGGARAASRALVRRCPR
jgi:hypothetical protein